MTPQKKQKPFTSIRIIGKRAQQMLTKARENLHTEQKVAKPAAPKERKEDVTIVHLSMKSVVQATFAILAIVVGMWLLFHLRHKILLLLLAAFVATVIDPGVSKLEQWKFPRGLAIIIHYLFAILLLFFLVLSLIPAIAEQLDEIGRSLTREWIPRLNNPDLHIPFVPAETNQTLNALIQNMMQNLSLDQFTTSLQETSEVLTNVASESVRFAKRIAGSVVNFLVSFIVVLVLAFFIQMEKEGISRWLLGFLPDPLRKYADKKTEAIHSKIGQWMRGELLLMLSIFGLTFIALFILQMDYALTLALLAGFCELIPAVGPFFAAIPAILIGGTQKGLIWIPIIAGVYYVIQWCENNLLVPLIMKRAVGLSPIAILFAMMVGISFPDTIHPILGVMLAVPVTTVIALFLEDWREGNSS